MGLNWVRVGLIGLDGGAGGRGRVGGGGLGLGGVERAVWC